MKIVSLEKYQTGLREEIHIVRGVYVSENIEPPCKVFEDRVYTYYTVC